MMPSLLIALSLFAADPKAKAAKEAIPAEPDDVLVLYNEHNAKWNTSGAKIVQVYLGLRGYVPLMTALLQPVKRADPCRFSRGRPEILFGAGDGANEVVENIYCLGRRKANWKS